MVPPSPGSQPRLSAGRVGDDAVAMSGILAAARRAVVTAARSTVLAPFMGLVISLAATSPSALPRDPPASGSGSGQRSALTEGLPTSGGTVSMEGPPRQEATSQDSKSVREPSGDVWADGVPSTGRWGWPLAPAPDVLNRFVAPEHRWSPGHRGVDLAAAVQQAVLAPDAGVVTFAGVIAGRGVVVVAHPRGLRSTFEPVEASLTAGTPVERGQTVAAVSAAPGHCALATCLHWGVLRGEAYLDPLLFVALPRVILLPMT